MPRTRATRRIGITKFVGDVVDDTKEFVDSVLDRIKDSERDLRDSASRALRYDEDDDERDDVEELKTELERLSGRIAALSTSEREPRQPSTGGAGH